MADDTTSHPLDWPGLAGVIVCCALWGGNAVAVKYAVPDLPPAGCAGLRFLVALPLLAVVCHRLGHALRVARPLWGLLVLHALLSALQIGTFNWGTSHSLAGRSSVFINVHPLVVAPLAWVLLGERLGWRGLLGMGAAVGGVLVLLSEPYRHGGGGPVGDLVVLTSGLIFALQTIAQKKTFPLIRPTTLLFHQTALAAPICLAYSAIMEGLPAFHLTPRTVWGLLYQGLAVSGVCFTIWLILLRRYPAGRLATLAFLTPLFGVGLGHVTQGDPLSRALVAGGSLVGLGIYLVASDRTAHARPPDIELPGEDAP